MNNPNFRYLATSALLLSSTILSPFTSATIVEFQTSQGNFQVNLYDEATPKTVENFLGYLNDGSYNNQVIHRSVENFIIQGGGFSFEGSFPFTPLASKPAVINEPTYSNVKKTIAMAKSAGSINSATSQWFFNLKDNSANLDLQNGGFTVFGEVIDDGMTVIEKIANIERCNYSDSMLDIPMPGTATVGCANIGTPGVENFVTVNQVIIIDSSSATANQLTPALTIDTDHDGVSNSQDAFPNDSSEYLDTDLDGIGNNADPDDDNDGVIDSNDAYPLDASRSVKESTDSGGGGPISWLSALLVSALFLRRRN